MSSPLRPALAAVLVLGSCGYPLPDPDSVRREFAKYDDRQLMQMYAETDRALAQGAYIAADFRRLHAWRRERMALEITRRGIAMDELDEIRKMNPSTRVVSERVEPQEPPPRIETR